jgi:hypothetical protein
MGEQGEMTSVWLVFLDYGSDDTYLGAFSTEELATAYANAKRNPSGWPRVKVYEEELDAVQP